MGTMDDKGSYPSVPPSRRRIPCGPCSSSIFDILSQVLVRYDSCACSCRNTSLSAAQLARTVGLLGGAVYLLFGRRSLQEKGRFDSKPMR